MNLSPAQLLLLNRGLPKWPQHYVTGVPVSVEQAMEIVRRTDSFFVSGHGGNDRAGDKVLARRLRLPHFSDPSEDYKQVDWSARTAQTARWSHAWGIVETEYIRNAWISCAFIGGPHGWCHPDGTIGNVTNVGKWPGAADIFEEWKVLAAAFPFLSLGATLMDGESGHSTNPVVSFEVRAGLVEVVDPAERSVHVGHPSPDVGTLNMEANVLKTIFVPPSQREHGCPSAWIDAWEKLAAEKESLWK
jgi:hypothetical protein